MDVSVYPIHLKRNKNMSAPIQYYVRDTGSLFTIGGQTIDLELVTRVESPPIFKGSGSIVPTTFTLLIDGCCSTTISNIASVSTLNKNAYQIITNKPYYTEIGPTSYGLNFYYSGSRLTVIPPGDFKDVLTDYGLMNSALSKSFASTSASFSGYYPFNATSIETASGFTVISINTTLGPNLSTGSIWLTQSIAEYRFNAISASIDLYRNFLTQFNLMTASLNKIKGNIN
jgi:hypothetical protein